MSTNNIEKMKDFLENYISQFSEFADKFEQSVNIFVNQVKEIEKEEVNKKTYKEIAKDLVSFICSKINSPKDKLLGLRIETYISKIKELYPKNINLEPFVPEKDNTIYKIEKLTSKGRTLEYLLMNILNNAILIAGSPTTQFSEECTGEDYESILYLWDDINKYLSIA